MVGKMINIDQRFGPCSFRVWGLILNFIGNAMAIYGAIGFIHNGSRLAVLLTGLFLTIVCILIVAKPARD